MKNFTFNKFLSFTLLFVSFCYGQVAPNYLKPFTARYNTTVNGDMIKIGNNLLNYDRVGGNGSKKDDSKTPANTPYNNSSSNSSSTSYANYNDILDMQFIDIDGVSSTKSSSSADLDIPDSKVGFDCHKVAYAGLYWSAMLNEGNKTTDRANINKIKIR